MVTRSGYSIVAVIYRNVYTQQWPESLQFLVESNDEEQNYCFPGGSPQLGENCYQTIVREMQEQYGLEINYTHSGVMYADIKVQPEPCISLLIECSLRNYTDGNREHQHRTYEKTKLVWCSMAELNEKSIYPEEILQYLISEIGELNGDGYMGYYALTKRGVEKHTYRSIWESRDEVLPIDPNFCDDRYVRSLW